MWGFIQSWAGARISESEPGLKNFYWAHKSIATQWPGSYAKILKRININKQKKMTKLQKTKMPVNINKIY